MNDEKCKRAKGENNVVGMPAFNSYSDNLQRHSFENFPAVATFIDRIEVTYSHHWQCSTVISLDLIKTLPYTSKRTQATTSERTPEENSCLLRRLI